MSHHPTGFCIKGLSEGVHVYTSMLRSLVNPSVGTIQRAKYPASELRLVDAIDIVRIAFLERRRSQTHERRVLTQLDKRFRATVTQARADTAR